jgi:hypothetical protein
VKAWARLVERCVCPSPPQEPTEHVTGISSREAWLTQGLCAGAAQMKGIMVALLSGSDHPDRIEKDDFVKLYHILRLRFKRSVQ